MTEQELFESLTDTSLDDVFRMKALKTFEWEMLPKITGYPMFRLTELQCQVLQHARSDFYDNILHIIDDHISYSHAVGIFMCGMYSYHAQRMQYKLRWYQFAKKRELDPNHFFHLYNSVDEFGSLEGLLNIDDKPYRKALHEFGLMVTKTDRVKYCDIRSLAHQRVRIDWIEKLLDFNGVKYD